jgi:hypothetical protein
VRHLVPRSFFDSVYPLKTSRQFVTTFRVSEQPHFGHPSRGGLGKPNSRLSGLCVLRVLLRQSPFSLAPPVQRPTRISVRQLLTLRPFPFLFSSSPAFLINQSFPHPCFISVSSVANPSSPFGNRFATTFRASEQPIWAPIWWRDWEANFVCFVVNFPLGLLCSLLFKVFFHPFAPPSLLSSWLPYKQSPSCIRVHSCPSVVIFFRSQFSLFSPVQILFPIRVLSVFHPWLFLCGESPYQKPVCRRLQIFAQPPW